MAIVFGKFPSLIILCLWKASAVYYSVFLMIMSSISFNRRNKIYSALNLISFINDWGLLRPNHRLTDSIIRNRSLAFLRMSLVTDQGFFDQDSLHMSTTVWRLSKSVRWLILSKWKFFSRVLFGGKCLIMGFLYSILQRPKLKPKVFKNNSATGIKSWFHFPKNIYFMLCPLKIS